MSLVLPGATSGQVTVDVPAVAGTTTLTLPATSGTVALTTTPITSSQLPSGSVLQVVTANDAGSSTTSTTAVNLNVSAISITPKSTNSKLVIQVSFQGIITAAGAGTNSYGYFQINEGATLRSTAARSIAVVSASGTNMQTNAGQHLIAVVTNSSLTARSFNLYGYSSTSSATCYGNNMTWVITEVAV